MKRELNDFQIIGENRPSLREVIAQDFKKLPGELPIKGGWGYSIEDAIVIDKNDPIVDQSIPFPGVAIEYQVVDKRLLEELIIFRPEDRYMGIIWKRNMQSCFGANGKSYDHLIIKGHCFSEEDFLSLKNEAIGCEDNPNFNIVEHFKKRERLMWHFTTEYFFDITSFFGK